MCQKKLDLACLYHITSDFRMGERLLGTSLECKPNFEELREILYKMQNGRCTWLVVSFSTLIEQAIITTVLQSTFGVRGCSWLGNLSSGFALSGFARCIGNGRFHALFEQAPLAKANRQSIP